MCLLYSLSEVAFVAVQALSKLTHADDQLEG